MFDAHARVSVRHHPGLTTDVDILLPAVAYQEVALDRAYDHPITAEDVIVHKLIAWRPRDRNDIASILEADQLSMRATSPTGPASGASLTRCTRREPPADAVVGNLGRSLPPH